MGLKSLSHSGRCICFRNRLLEFDPERVSVLILFTTEAQRTLRKSYFCLWGDNDKQKTIKNSFTVNPAGYWYELFVENRHLPILYNICPLCELYAWQSPE
jgi:hypothetical protein